MNILGIDAGLSAPGFAVADKDYNLIHVECLQPELVMINALIASTKVKTKSEAAKTLNKLSQTAYDLERIRIISDRINGLICLYSPSIVVVEFPTGGAKSAAAIKGMAFSTGVTAATLASANYTGRQFTLVPITPMQNKKGSTGQTKWQDSDDKWSVLWAIDEIWPNVPWPRKKSKRCADEYDETTCWAIADACSCIATYMRDRKIPFSGVRYISS